MRLEELHLGGFVGVPDAHTCCVLDSVQPRTLGHTVAKAPDESQATAVTGNPRCWPDCGGAGNWTPCFRGNGLLLVGVASVGGGLELAYIQGDALVSLPDKPRHRPHWDVTSTKRQPHFIHGEHACRVRRPICSFTPSTTCTDYPTSHSRLSWRNSTPRNMILHIPTFGSGSTP